MKRFLTSLLAVGLALCVPLASNAQDTGYYAQKTYTATGSSAVFAVPFPYITQSDIQVSVNGVLQDSSAYTFTAPSVVTLTATPTAGLTVLLKRSTSIAAPKSVFNGGSLSSASLNANGYQAVYLAQELLDVVTYISQQSLSQMATLPNATTPLTGSETVPLTQTSVARKAPVSAFTTGLNLNPSGITLSSSGHAGLTFTSSFQGNAFPGIILNAPGTGLTITKTLGAGARSQDAADVFIGRDANYSGGTPFFTNSGLKVSTTARAGTMSFEWPFLSIIDNEATAADGSQNVGGYFQALKRSTGHTWATTEELQDFNANPTTTSVVKELDLAATGTDTNSQRAFLNLFASSKTGAGATVAEGMAFHTDGVTTIGNPLDFYGNYTNGLKLNDGTFTNGAILMGDGQKVCMNGISCGAYVTHNSSAWRFHTGSGDVFTVGDTGGITTTGATGVSCPAASLTTLVVTNGIVTHC